VPTARPLAASPDQDKLPKRVKVEISRCIRDTVLARELKARYDHTCQLCGTRITLPNGEGYSEAHHVRPLALAHRGRDRRDNLIVLCPTHHAEFDYGVLALTPNGRHVIHLDTRDDVHGARVHFERGHVLASDVLKYHRRRIFGRSF
jgi:predicted restriction endonuclease